MALKPSLTDLFPIFFYFIVKVMIGIFVLSGSSHLPHDSDFTLFNQFFLLFALLNVVSTAGLQNGIIRETATTRDEPERLALVLSAAGVVVVPVALAIILTSVVAGPAISTLLVGSGAYGSLVGIVAVLAVCSGLGQILCAVLTGTGRGRSAMIVQTVSLVLAGGLTIWRLRSGDVVGAIVAYGAGCAVLPLLAGLSLSHLRGPRLADRRIDRAMLVQLTRFSAAYLVTASAMPLTLFALRSVYRHHLGETMLSNWLAANRVSDVLTQFTGLYMTQIHLPRFSAARTATQALRVARHSLLTAGAIMVSGATVFFIAADFWIRLFLSARFVPAREIISLYVVGDTLRTIPSTLLFSALALGRTGTAAGLELMNAGLFAAVTLVLLGLGYAMAPAFAYIAASFSVAIVGALVLRRSQPLPRLAG